MNLVDTTFGAVFIGLTASIFAFGILSAQIYTYCYRYPLDTHFYKALVICLWILEVVHTILNCQFFYELTISNWGRVLVFAEKPPWSLVLQVAFSATVGTIVKGCFGMRVWRFSKHNIWITGLVLLSILVQYGVSIWFTVEGFGIRSLLDIHLMSRIAVVALALGAATDLFIALALCYYLRKLKSPQQRSNSLVNHLMLYAINTGILTSAFSIACLFCFAFMANNFIFIGLYFVLSKLYANSFLATLNTRTCLKGQGTFRDMETVPTFVMQLPRLGFGPDDENNSDQHDSEFQISVQREVSIKFDGSVMTPVEPYPYCVA